MNQPHAHLQLAGTRFPAKKAEQVPSNTRTASGGIPVLIQFVLWRRYTAATGCSMGTGAPAVAESLTSEHFAICAFVNELLQLQLISTACGAIGVLRNANLPAHVLDASCKKQRQQPHAEVKLRMWPTM